MDGEIFGPILPIANTDAREAVGIALKHPKPLSLYIYTRDRKLANALMARIASGGACVNDCIIHISSPHLPFGGNGDSGMGAYHGKATFDAFTHFKSVMRKPFALDNPMRYAPYMKLSRLLKWMLGKVM
jgi:acyl-CoA reductase-like NAD-dependent aldehyde dehydrogenase